MRADRAEPCGPQLIAQSLRRVGIIALVGLVMTAF